MNIEFMMSSKAYHSFNGVTGARMGERHPVMIKAKMESIIAVMASSERHAHAEYFCEGYLIPPKIEKYERVIEWINNNGCVYAPIIDLLRNSASDFKICDGRHTLIALKKYFLMEEIKVVVPHDKQFLLSEAFG